MTEVMPGRWYLLLIVILVWCMVGSATVFAADDGYSGVMAPSAPNSPTDNKVEEESAPPGYEGVVPGHSEEQPAQVDDDLMKERSVQMTPVPGLGPPKTAADVEWMAARRQMTKGEDGLPDSFLEKLKLSDKQKSLLAGAPVRIGGMAPAEYMVKKNIDEWMPKIKDEKISVEERDKNIEEARKIWTMMADSLRRKVAIPDSVYRRIGMPDSFAQEEKESSSHALSLVESALKELQQY